MNRPPTRPAEGGILSFLQFYKRPGFQHTWGVICDWALKPLVQGLCFGAASWFSKYIVEYFLQWRQSRIGHVVVDANGLYELHDMQNKLNLLVARAEAAAGYVVKPPVRVMVPIMQGGPMPGATLSSSAPPGGDGVNPASVSVAIAGTPQNTSTAA